MAAAVMTKGTKEHSSLELAQIMEDNGIKISPSVVSADSFSINILTTKGQRSTTLSLLDEIVNRAIFDDYEIENKNCKIKFHKKIP